jgi:hypothetical protein
VLNFIKYTVILLVQFGLFLSMLITLKVANLIEYKDTRLQILQNEVIIMVSDFTKKAQKYIEELSDRESLHFRNSESKS